MSHSRSPGYVPGEHWVECMSCGFEIRASQIKKRWDGLLVCPKDFEYRPAQDFLRAVPDNQTAKGPINPASKLKWVDDTNEPSNTPPITGTFGSFSY